MNLSELLPAVSRICAGAGEQIMAIYESEDFGVSVKDDDSPLTRADLAAHRFIVEALGALSRDPILSEEAADIDYAQRADWRRYWLVDPLDGTKEFIKRNGDFTVNIALIDDGYPVLGVVHAPALALTYAAADGLGAQRSKDGECKTISVRQAPAVPAFVVSRSHKDAALESFLAAAPSHEAVSRGSSLKFCQVAEGSADLYPRTGPTSEWDTAAGQCVAEQAGARVLRLPELDRLRYNQKESLLNPRFAVVGDDSQGWQDLLRSIS